MVDAREVYRSHPESYDELVRYEDREGNLLPAIGALAPLANAEVVELGAGTGRLTALLAPHVRSIRAFDIAVPMMAVGRRKLARLERCNWGFGVADNACLPVPDGSADLAIAGWSFGHQTVWSEDAWRAPIESALREALRVLRPTGTAVVVETLGTGHASPFEPPPQLARYYAMLGDEHGFERTWIRTDYEFPTVAEGEKLVRFFFGEDPAADFVVRGSRVLPECTGLWWRRKQESC
jgi:ubiquinone/menaquinone biosynthesis C-methylase UbiE